MIRVLLTTHIGPLMLVCSFLFCIGPAQADMGKQSNTVSATAMFSNPPLVVIMQQMNVIRSTPLGAPVRCPLLDWPVFHPGWVRDCSLQDGGAGHTGIHKHYIQRNTSLPFFDVCIYIYIHIYIHILSDTHGKLFSPKDRSSCETEFDAHFW